MCFRMIATTWAILACVPSTALAAQKTVTVAPSGWEDSSVRVLVSSHASSPNGLTSLLRQYTKPQSRARLDSLADSMVAITLRHAQRGAEGERTVEDFILAFQSADLPNDDLGTRYQGAQERLIRIFRELPKDNRARLYVIWSMRISEQANEFLYQVAISNDDAAPHAMSTLLSFLTPDTDPYRAGTPALRAPLEARLRLLARQVRREETASYLSRARPGVMQTVKDGYAPSLPDHNARLNLLGFAQRMKWNLSPPD